MENSKKILNLLGLATKAGKIASGEFAAEKGEKRKGSFGDCIGRSIGQYQKDVPEYVYLLQGPDFLFRKERRTGARNGKRDAGISGLTGCRFFQGTRETDGAERR